MKPILLLSTFAFTGCVCAVVDPGMIGVRVNLGEVLEPTALPGLLWKSPLTSVHKVSVRQSTEEAKAPCFSADLQQVNATVKVMYRIPEDKVIAVFTQYQGNPFESLVAPRVQEALKETTATLTAEQIVKQREAVKLKALDLARAKMGGLLELRDIVIENIDLSPELEHAIEAKMVQEQEAAKAKFAQQQTQIEAETAIIRAKGAAEAIRIQGQALKENGAVLQLRVVEKWNGVTPLVIGAESGTNILLPLKGTP